MTDNLHGANTDGNLNFGGRIIPDLDSIANLILARLTLLAAKAGGFLGRRVTTLTLAKGPARPYENDAAALDYFSASSFQVLR